MKPDQFIGYCLANASSITSIVGTRIFNSIRPNSTTLSLIPAINYYEVSSGGELNGLGQKNITVNARAETQRQAIDLGDKIIKLFNGANGSGIQGTLNGFDLDKMYLLNIGGLIPENDTGWYNYPIDFKMIYRLDTVS